MEDINNPLKAVRDIYQANQGSSEQHDAAVKTHFEAVVASGAKIPVVTPSAMDMLPNNSLVRFRGMVQDMLNPEFYVGEYRRSDGTWHTAKYCDELNEALPTDGETKLAERKPVLLVPVPHEVPWVKSVHTATAAASLDDALFASRSFTKQKRTRDAVDDDSSAAAEPSAEDAMAVEVVGTATAKPRVDTAPAPSTGKSGASIPAQGEENSDVEYTIPEGSCMVYMYTDATIKLNDVVEVVGVLSRVPELAAAHMGMETDGGADGLHTNNTTSANPNAATLLDQEMLAAHPPTSQCPRLHAVLTHIEAGPFPAAATSAALSAADAAEGRARALGFLSMVLGGDDLAAQYLLLQLVSKVHTRDPQNGVIGTLPLNITACPVAPSLDTTNTNTKAEESSNLSALGAGIAIALEALFPRVLSTSLSVSTLNNRPWWPGRNQNNLHLMTGPLQMAAGTQILLDETTMAAGQLNQVGLRNLAALQEIMRAQKVAYDFEYFALDQMSDAPVTVLSLGKTLLKGFGEVEIPLKPTAPTGDGAGVAAAVAGADLGLARAYLAAARGIEFKLDEPISKFLETELAQAKQKNTEVNQHTFHRWLNVARLLAVSYGEQGLSQERWRQAMEMEAQREQRLIHQVRP